MNAYELAEYLKAYVNEVTDYDMEYHQAAASLLILQMEEVKALRKQLIAATSELMDTKRWTSTTFMPYIRAKWAVRKRNEAGIG